MRAKATSRPGIDLGATASKTLQGAAEEASKFITQYQKADLATQASILAALRAVNSLAGDSGAKTTLTQENPRALIALAANLKLAQALAACFATYKTRVIEGEPYQVAQTIPIDRTYADYLIKCQALSVALHEAFPEKYRAKQAISPEFFAWYLTLPGFQAKGTGLETITDGCVSGIKGMTREQATRKLAEQGLKHEDRVVLVAAHTGGYLLNASSILNNKWARSAVDVFEFDNQCGLRPIGVPIDYIGDEMSSTARRVPPN